MTKNKPARDPNAPKRNLSAYLLYQNAMRDTFKAQNPGMTFGQLSKYTSAMYAEMPPNEKEAWQARAEADKNRFLHEMATYVPPPGYDARGEARIVNNTYVNKKGKMSRDPNAPKRNLSPYLLYQNAMRDQFKLDNPGMTFGQLSKYTSHMYKSLTPEEKAAWDTKAEEDKARFEYEMRAYAPPPGYDANGNLIEDGTMMKRNKKSRDPNAPKRARGSFVFFTFDMRPKIMAEFPDIKFVDMGTILGERWRALSPEEKQVYEDMANEDKERFNKEMQAYNSEKAEAMARNHAEMAQMRAVQQQQQQQYVMAPQSYMDMSHMQQYHEQGHEQHMQPHMQYDNYHQY